MALKSIVTGTVSDSSITPRKTNDYCELLIIKDERIMEYTYSRFLRAKSR